MAHLRFADAGTFAASRALRRAGVRVVFTLAPDPHALIAEGERSGALTRAAFAERESAEHNLFRLRLVDELAATADRLVILPRAGGRDEVERLLGRRLPAERTTAVPEGISLDADRACARGAAARALPAARILVRGLAAARPARRGLPIILSVGRFHPVKGFTRSSRPGRGDAQLAASYNLVLVGGDLERPTHGGAARPRGDRRASGAARRARPARGPASRRHRRAPRDRRASASRARRRRPASTPARASRRSSASRCSRRSRRDCRWSRRRAAARRPTSTTVSPASSPAGRRRRAPERAPPSGALLARRPGRAARAQRLVRDRFDIRRMAARPGDVYAAASHDRPCSSVRTTPRTTAAVGRRPGAAPARGAVIVATGAGLACTQWSPTGSNTPARLGAGSNPGLMRVDGAGGRGGAAAGRSSPPRERRRAAPPTRPSSACTTCSGDRTRAPRGCARSSTSSSPRSARRPARLRRDPRAPRARAAVRLVLPGHPSQLPPPGLRRPSPSSRRARRRPDGARRLHALCAEVAATVRRRVRGALDELNPRPRP